MDARTTDLAHALTQIAGDDPRQRDEGVRTITAIVRYQVGQICTRYGMLDSVEDEVQEVMLRIVVSSPRYDPTRPPQPWLRTIAIRHIKTKYKLSKMQKRTPTNGGTTVSIDAIHGASDATLAMTLTDYREQSPLDRLADQEAREGIYDRLQRLLSRLEYAAIVGTSNGDSYAQIAASVTATVRAVDNAKVRAINKLRRIGEATRDGEQDISAVFKAIDKCCPPELAGDQSDVDNKVGD